MRFLSKYRTHVAYAATICGNVGTAIELSSSPVIWTESPKIKVTNKLGNIQFNVDLINPCQVLATLYQELQKDAHHKCNQIYGDLVSNEIESCCLAESEAQGVSYTDTNLDWDCRRHGISCICDIYVSTKFGIYYYVG